MKYTRVLGMLYKAVLVFLKGLLVILSTALIVIVFGNVVGRYGFNHSWAWATEASEFLFIWVVFIAAVLTNEKYEHMNLDIVLRWFPGTAGRIIQFVSQILFLVVLAIITRGGLSQVTGNLTYYSPSLGIPYGVVYSVIPVSTFLMMLQTVGRMVRIVTGSLSSFEKRDY